MPELHSDDEGAPPAKRARPEAGETKESPASAVAALATTAAVPTADDILARATAPPDPSVNHRAMLSDECVLALEIDTPTAEGSHLFVSFAPGDTTAKVHIFQPITGTKPTSSVTTYVCSVIACDSEFFEGRGAPPKTEEGAADGMFYHDEDDLVVFTGLVTGQRAAAFPAATGVCYLEFVRGQELFLHNPTTRGHIKYKIPVCGAPYMETMAVSFINEKFDQQEKNYALPSDDIAIIRQFLDNTEGDRFQFSVQYQEAEERAVLRFMDETGTNVFVFQLCIKEGGSEPLFPRDWRDDIPSIVDSTMLKETFKEGCNVRTERIDIATGTEGEGEVKFPFFITHARTSTGSVRQALCAFCD